MRHEDLLGRLKQHGIEGRIVALHRVPELEEGIRGPRRQGLFDEQFYADELSGFDFRSPAGLSADGSLLILAMPRPRNVLTFRWRGQEVRCDIPPTYFEKENNRRIRSLLTRILSPAGYRVYKAVLPQKLLAVRSGLAAYGKNNITYVKGMGSYHSLTAVYSDLPAEGDAWREPAMMDACKRCSACARHCPAGAIDPERFLLHAERCITYHNEKPYRVSFPDWMDDAWHNCLVGCMLCQRACPRNRRHPPQVREAAQFTETETALLLLQDGRIPATVSGKLKRAGMAALKSVLSRNLPPLLAAAEPGRGGAERRAASG
jgi:epoxyqueuosine reductase